jgi:hypothetical protein
MLSPGLLKSSTDLLVSQNRAQRLVFVAVDIRESIDSRVIETALVSSMEVGLYGRGTADGRQERGGILVD